MQYPALMIPGHSTQKPRPHLQPPAYFAALGMYPVAQTTNITLCFESPKTTQAERRREKTPRGHVRMNKYPNPIRIRIR